MRALLGFALKLHLLLGRSGHLKWTEGHDAPLLQLDAADLQQPDGLSGLHFRPTEGLGRSAALKLTCEPPHLALFHLARG